jgi:NADPH-dependent curcumin reductase CurA
MAIGMTRNRCWRIARPIDGWPPDPMRIRVGEKMRSGIIPSDTPFAGGTVGQVVEPRHSAYRPRDYKFGGRYWQDYKALTAMLR